MVAVRKVCQKCYIRIESSTIVLKSLGSVLFSSSSSSNDSCLSLFNGTKDPSPFMRENISSFFNSIILISFCSILKTGW